MEYDYTSLGAPDKLRTLIAEIERTVYRDTPRAAQLCEEALALAHEYGLRNEEGGIFISRAQISQKLSQFDRALLEAHQGLGIFEDLEDADGLARAHRITGTIYADMGRYDVARTHFEQGLEIAVQHKLMEREIQICSNFGKIFTDMGFYEHALEYNLRALGLNTQYGNKVWLATNLNNLAGVFFHLKNYEKSLENMRRVLNIAYEIDSSDLEAMSLVNIGTLCNTLGRLEEGLDYQLQALRRAEDGDERRLAHVLENVGGTYVLLKRFDEAREHLERALRLSQSIPYPLEVAMTCKNFGLYHLGKGEYDEALGYFKRAADMAEAMSLRDVMTDVEERMAFAYEQMDNPRLALEHYRKYQELRNKMLDEQNRQRMEEIQSRFDNAERAKLRETEAVRQALSEVLPNS